jgi:hypothetical protein
VNGQDILTIGVIIGGIAYFVGQVVSSRKKGAGDALRIALDEVAAVKIRADRFEKELVAVQAQVHSLEKENGTLRELLVSRDGLDEKLTTALQDALEKQTRRLVDVMREEKRA